MSKYIFKELVYDDLWHLFFPALRENDMATEDEEFEEGAPDNDEDDVGAVEKSADPQRITRRIRLVRRIRRRRLRRLPRIRRRFRRVRRTLRVRRFRRPRRLRG